jgi:hypothetical protein
MSQRKALPSITASSIRMARTNPLASGDLLRRRSPFEREARDDPIRLLLDQTVMKARSADVRFLKELAQSHDRCELLRTVPGNHKWLKLDASNGLLGTGTIYQPVSDYDSASLDRLPDWMKGREGVFKESFAIGSGAAPLLADQAGIDHASAVTYCLLASSPSSCSRHSRTTT